MPDHEPPYDEVARILDDEDETRYAEADELLDRARADGDAVPARTKPVWGLQVESRCWSSDSRGLQGEPG